MIARIAPVSRELILCNIAEKALGLPKFLGRPAVDLQAVRLLVGADQGARVHAGLAVDLGDRIAQRLQALLDALDALGGELLDVGPGRRESGAAGDAVAEIADEQRVEVGHVVALDDEEVLERQERGSVGAGRRQDEGLLVERISGNGPRARADDAELDPLAERLGVVGPFLQAGDILGQPHLVAPGLVRHPALGAQLVGGRPECVRHRVPDVLAAVAVEVIGHGVVFRRHELGEAHGAGPRSSHGLARAHAVLQHLQRVQQLGAEQVLAAAEIGLGGERLDDVIVRPVRPERRLPAPDGQHELALHAELALDLGEPGGVLRLQGPALLCQLGEVGGAQILGGRLGELGLPLHVALAGQHEVGQRQVRLDAAQGRVERGARHAHRLRLGPQRLEEAAETYRSGPLADPRQEQEDQRCQLCTQHARGPIGPRQSPVDVRHAALPTGQGQPGPGLGFPVRDPTPNRGHYGPIVGPGRWLRGGLPRG